MALEKGFYRDAGFAVDIREVEVNKTAVDELSNGHVQYAVVDPGILLARADGVPVKVLASIFQHSPLALIVRREATIQNISDLRGKRIMMAPGLNADISAALGKVGITSSDFVRQDTSYHIHDLLNGKTDAFSGYITDQPHQLDLLGVPYRIFHPKKQGIDFYGDILVTLEKEIDEHPERVRLFSEASMRGWHYAIEHIDETIDVILHKYNSQSLSRAQLQFEAKKTKEMILGDVIQVGYMSQHRWQHIADVYIAQGLLPKGFSVSEVIYRPKVGFAEVINRNRWQFAIGALLLFIFLLGLHTIYLRRAVKFRTAELERNEKRFSGIVEMAGDAVIASNEKQEIILFNRAAEVMFGFSRRDVLGEDIGKLMPERYRRKHRERVEMFLTDKDKHFIKLNSNMFGMRKSGEEFRIESSISKLILDDGIVMTVMLRDITVQLHTEESQRKQIKAIAEAGEAVMITDRNAIIEYVNPAFTKITGYLPEEVIGKTPAILKSTAQDASLYKELWDTITRGEVWHGTLIDKRKDGSFYPAMMSIAPIHGDEGEITHYVSLQQDMSEYQKMEEQFLQAQKMEAIGTLVGGIAHDFNNMLTAIQGNVYLSKLKLENPSKVKERLDNIELLGIRAADMVKQLLTFARKDHVKMSLFSLNSFLKETCKLIRTAIPENIKFVFDSCEEILIVNGDATQLQQVVMNLLNNARDAVYDAKQPRIELKLSLYIPTDMFMKTHQEAKGVKFAALEVWDNGYGIAKDHLNKVFEPFFTTKSVDQGTGLGLAMVYGAVHSHDGILEVESKSGEGSVFSVYLPLKEGFEALGEGENCIVRGQGETILLVDDDIEMCDITCKVLNSLNYNVLIAHNGEEALEVFTGHRTMIELIFTDIVMPKMNAYELMASIRQLGHDVPVIFMTGYDKKQAIASEDQDGQDSVINKPFSIVELSQLLRRKMNPTAPD